MCFLIELFFSCQLLHEAALYILQKKVKFFSFKTLLVLAFLGEVQSKFHFHSLIGREHCAQRASAALHAHLHIGLCI